MSSPHAVAPGPLRVMGALTGGLSVLGSLVIIIVFAPRIKSLYHGPARSTSHQEKIKALQGGYQLTLLWLAFADAVVGASWAASAFVAPGTHENFCRVQGFFIEFGVIASAVWTACLAHEMYRITVALQEEVRGNFATRRYKFYMGLSWVLAVAAACIAGFEGDFASAGGWCWVVNRFDLAQVLVVYVPLLGCLVFLVVTYTRISLWIHATFRERMGIKQECQKLLKLAAFPMVFLCIWFVPVIARLVHSATTDEDKPAAGPVPVITALLAPSQGWVNAIVYTCINRSVMAQVVTTLGCAKCCRRQGDSPSSSQHSQATPHRPGPSNAPYSQMA